MSGPCAYLAQDTGDSHHGPVTVVPLTNLVPESHREVSSPAAQLIDVLSWCQKRSVLGKHWFQTPEANGCRKNAVITIRDDPCRWPGSEGLQGRSHSKKVHYEIATARA